MSDPVSALGNSAQPTPVTAAQVLPGTAQGQALQASAPVASASAAAKPDPATASSGAQGASTPAPMTMEQAAQAYQSYLSSLPSNLEIQPDTQAGVTVMKVVNPVTQKVIKQLPTDDMIQMAKFLRNAENQNHSGILLDQSL